MAKRTRPPTLLSLAYRLVRDESLFGRGDTVVCACSGGPDSQALLDVLALLRGRVGHEVVAVGIDHGLRPEASSELDLAEAHAAARGVAWERHRSLVTPGANLQARARAARLGALDDACQRHGAVAIATGHTADDRAETVLLRLLRGAGPRGLAVLPARGRGPTTAALVRPLLRARRDDVLAHLARQTVPFALDPSNLDPRFLRVRVRRELLPLCAALAPRVVDHLCALADMLPPLLDADDGRDLAEQTGAGVALGKAQRLAVARARRLGRAQVTLRVSGGRDVALCLGRGLPNP